jgi:uncharacterized protein YjdB
MYPSVSNLPLIGGESFVRSAISPADRPSIFTWVFLGRLPITKVVTPAYNNQVLTAGANNRYIARITVSRIPVVSATLNIAVGAEADFTFANAYSVVSADPAFATAAIANGVVTITGVAAGTTLVTISDRDGNKIAEITVTVA